MRKKWWKKMLACTLAFSMGLLPALPAKAAPESNVLTEADKTLKLWYDEPARRTGFDRKVDNKDIDTGFEAESLPLGNGYMGVNVWGYDTEAVYVTENSMSNPYPEGLNLLAKTWIDFGHKDVENYTRDLVLDDATAHVNYECNGVKYSREYFTSYPDKVMAIKLEASGKGNLSFTLRPEAPFLRTGDKGKTGTVIASDDGTIILSGRMNYQKINYEGQYRVIPTGGKMEATTGEDGGGQIEVSGADSAVILLAVGTNYEMKPETFTKPDGQKLDANNLPHDKVTQYLDDAEKLSYKELRQRHVEDYRTYYARVNLNLGGQESNKTTDQLLDAYKTGTADAYLEELLFQYGRYLLIASSREGCLPANLQGIWNAYENSPWSAGYWHNINEQMNYWPAFVTNMPEMFQSYADFNEAFRNSAEKNADTYLTKINSPLKAENETGENGWAIGTGVWPYSTEAPPVGSHSGPGVGAFTSTLFWDWYDFTRDPQILANHTYPAVAGMAKFLSKSLIEKDGLFLVSPSASPENANKKSTVGCAFDQQMTWENHQDLLKAAELLGTEEPIVLTAREQIDKLDPVNIGYSGQVKEYREENYYGEFGEEQHRHISQLVGLYPGTSINHETEAWMDAAKISLEKRGLGSTGWSIVHRLCAWARVGDGDVCYQEVQELLKNKIMKNLWDTHPPYQIDGNLGVTAGIGEMLLQSHEGYIAPLAALPSAWANGSYEGLLARGNFVVDAAWAKGTATSFEITSQSGGNCKVKYPGLESANVTDGEGNAVSVSVDGEDTITFDTVKGQTYTINGIQAVEETLAPTKLTLSNHAEGIQLKWNGSANAAYYRVYQAVNDAADYELVAGNVDGTAYIYTEEDMASKFSAEDRVTLRVTAVGENGRESEGITVQRLPILAPETVEGVFVDDTLQLTIKETAAAEKYAVYQKDGENWIKLFETEYKTACIEKASKEAVYAVSAIRETGESKKTEVTITEAAVLDNILLNKPVEVTSTHTTHPSYPVTMVVDGIVNPNDASNRVAINGDKAGSWTMVADLQGTYMLDILSIAEWKDKDGKTRSKNTKIEILTPDNEWVAVYDGVPLEMGKIKEFDMQKKEAKKLRFTFDNQGDPKAYASISEIMCSAVTPEPVNKQELFNALQSIREYNFNEYISKPVVNELRDLQKEGVAMLENTLATQDKIDEITAKLQKAIEGFVDIDKNILLGQNVETNAPEYDGRFVKEYMVDGDSNTRYAGKDDGNELTATVTLDGIYRIDSLYVQEYLNDNTETRGGETTIDILSNGEWVTVVDKQSLTSTQDKKGKTQATTEFKLDTPINGSAVRFHFKNLQDNKKKITIYELQATGAKLPSVTGVETLSGIRVDEGTTVDNLELPVEVTVNLDDGTTAALSVTWSTEGYDGTVPGKYTLTGTLELTDTILNPEGITVSIEVTVWADEWDRLNQAITDAQSKEQDSYTSESWANMQETLGEALAFLENTGATPDEIAAMAEKLERAVDGLAERGDKTALSQVIEQADVLAADDRYYTVESWGAMQDMLANAKAVYDNVDAVQKDVDAARKALEDAINGLTLDTSALDELIAYVGTLDASQYTVESWNTLIVERDKALTLLVSPDLTGAAIEEETAALQTAIDGLEKNPPHTGTLKDTIKKAEEINGGTYTNESYQNMLNALKAAKDVLANENATQEEIDTAAKALNDAIGALKPMEGGSGEGGSGEGGPSEGGPSEGGSGESGPSEGGSGEGGSGESGPSEGGSGESGVPGTGSGEGGVPGTGSGEGGVPGTGSGENGVPGTGSTGTTQTGSGNSQGSVQTGDASNPVIPIWSMGISVLVIIGVCALGFRRRKNQ